MGQKQEQWVALPPQFWTKCAFDHSHPFIDILASWSGRIRSRTEDGRNFQRLCLSHLAVC